MRLKVGLILGVLFIAGSVMPTRSQPPLPTKTAYIKTDMDNGAVLETVIAEDDLDRLVVYFRDPMLGSECSSSFENASKHTQDSADVKCDDRVVGMLTLKGLTDRQGFNGYLELNSGGTGWFTVQQPTTPPVAAAPAPPVEIAPPPPPPAAAPVDADLADGQTAYPDPYVAGYPGASGCTSENAYGATSCITGLPRTQSVQGYYRRSGTYVQGYVRSHR